LYVLSHIRLTMCCCFPEDTTYAILFMETVSINYWNLIKIMTAIFEKIAIVFGDHLKGPYSTCGMMFRDYLERERKKVRMCRHVYIHAHTHTRYFINPKLLFFSKTKQVSIVLNSVLFKIISTLHLLFLHATNSD
jgi:hypothetical protein